MLQSFLSSIEKKEQYGRKRENVNIKESNIRRYIQI